MPRGGRGRILPGVLFITSVCTVLAGGMAARYGLSWPRRLSWPRPPGAIIHHSASAAHQNGAPVDAALIDRWHEARSWGQETADAVYHIGYHYVILPDGTVDAGRPEWMRGAHCRGHNDHLGICLVGNFSSSANPTGRTQPARPTAEQLNALHNLLLDLMSKYHFGPEAIRRHRDLAQTACPGDRFPFDAVVQRLEQERDAPGQ